MKFNVKSYVNLIQLISKNYKIVSFSMANQQMATNNNLSGFCCLRHDVDYCLESAYKLAYIESDLNIISSYYILIDSDSYNPFSKESRYFIKEICRLKHELGLHFDVASYNKQLNKKITIIQQKSYLEDLSGREIKSFSYHNPGVIGLHNLDLSSHVEGLSSTYSKHFNEKFCYISDSLCRFRNPKIIKSISNIDYKNIHILLHPIWWIGNGKKRDEKIINNINKKKKKLLEQYNSILVQYGIMT